MFPLLCRRPDRECEFVVPAVVTSFELKDLLTSRISPGEPNGVIEGVRAAATVQCCLFGVRDDLGKGLAQGDLARVRLGEQEPSVSIASITAARTRGSLYPRLAGPYEAW